MPLPVCQTPEIIKRMVILRGRFKLATFYAFEKKAMVRWVPEYSLEAEEATYVSRLPP